MRGRGILLLAPLALGAQETPRANTYPLFAVFPEPLPEGRTELSLSFSNQFLRPSLERSGDGRSFARVDGEEWGLTADLAHALGPGRVNLRLRGIQRSGGVSDQAIWTYHQVFGFPQGGREDAPRDRLDYRLSRDGILVGDLRRSGFHLMDADLAYVVPFGNLEKGGRWGFSAQLPTGRRRDWSGNGGTDVAAGGALWKARGPWRAHLQAERVLAGVPQGSPYRAVLARRSFSRVWAGGAWQGSGPGFWRGLGLDVTVGYQESPYHVGIPRVDRSGWQQHWTFSHRALPRWRFGISEDAGTYSNPDITIYVICRL